MNIWKNVEPISHQEAQNKLAGKNVDDICDVLVRLAFHDPDRNWVQNECLRYLGHSEVNVRGVAATCLGHLARIHGTLDRHKVLPALEALANDPQIGGRIQDAIDDIKKFA